MKKVPLLVALATCFLASPVWSDSFTVGVEATDYMPIYKGDGSNYTGYAKELLDGFASKNGHTFTYVRLQGNRMNAIVVDCKKYRLRSIAYRGAVHSL